MKRSYIPLVAAIAFVLGAAGVILLCPPAAAWIKGIFMIFQHMIRGSSHDHTASVSGNLLDNFMLRGYRKAYYLRTQIKVVKNPGRIFVEV